ncbi:hypothetical protein, partial [Bacillus cereus group sp. Bce001]|uniref:hypothetical protein n=1 Tax=Bacillus cereus group sp. Bce001 TaxID=3445260 RepID=UPI003F69E790
TKVSLSAGRGVFIEGSVCALSSLFDGKALKLDENYYKFNDFRLPTSPVGFPILSRIALTR